jgi:DUF3047 family protein
MRALAAAAWFAASLALAADSVAIPAFSTASPGNALPGGWGRVSLPYGKHSDIRIVADEGASVLRVHSEHSFGSVAHTMAADAARTPILTWRWKIDRVVAGARLERKSGEDFAARVYVSFDYPEDRLPFTTRAKLALARTFYDFVPSAAICYVWDNSHPPGTAAWSPHFDHVRMVVLESGAANAGKWMPERRDVEADFRAAFTDWRGPVPRVNGVVAGNDTDQTGESATAWFGDFRLGAKP